MRERLEEWQETLEATAACILILWVHAFTWWLPDDWQPRIPE